MNLRFVQSALAAIVAPLSFFVATACAAKTPVDIGTTSQGSISYATAAALAQVFYEKGDMRARIQPNSGGGSLLPLVDNGELDLGISAVGEVEEAYKGMHLFEGRPQTNLRVVAVLYPLRSAIFVRSASNIQKVADLRGKRLTTGFKAMHALDRVLNAVLANGGISQADVTQVMVPNVIRGAEDFMTGKADAFFFGVGAGKVLEVDATVGGVRLLPIDTSPGAMKRMRDIFQYAYPVLEKPAGSSAGVTKPVYVMAYDNLLLTNADVPDDRIREILDLIDANSGALAGMSAQFRKFSRDQMYKELPLPYHPAAVEWYEAHGIKKVSQE